MIADTPPPQARQWPALYETLAAVCFSALPVVAIVAPRFLALAPALAALLLLPAWRCSTGAWAKIPVLPLRWALALAGLMTLSIIWAYNPEAAQERTLKTLPLLLGGVVLFGLTRSMNGEAFRKYFPIGMIVTAIILCVELYGGQPLTLMIKPELLQAAETGNTSELNRSVVFFALCFFPALACCRTNYKSWKTALLVLTGAAVLFQTDSQSAQMAVIAGLAFYFGFPARIKAAWFFVAALLMLAMLAMPWAVQAAFDHFASSADKQGGFLREGYAAMRLEIWDFIARRIMENPLYGFGVDSAEFMKFDSQKIYFDADHVLHPHGFILQLWLEFGVMGPLFAGALFSAIMLGIYRMKPEAHRPLLALLFAAIAAAAASYGLWQGWWIGALSLLLSFGPLSLQKNDQ